MIKKGKIINLSEFINTNLHNDNQVYNTLVSKHKLFVSKLTFTLNTC